MKNHQPPVERPVVNSKEFMRMLDVSPNTFGKMLKKGTLPKPMDLPTRERKWRRSDVEAFFGFSS